MNTAQTRPTSDSATLCGCGCGVATVRPTARFLSGHDAILKSRLIRTALKDPTNATEAEARNVARAELTRLGWQAHLALSAASLARKAADRKAAAKGRAATKPATRKPATKRTGAKAPAAVPATERAAGSDGRVPASVGS